MAQPLLIWGIFLFLACVFISVEAAGTTSANHQLRCRKCREAIYLDDCKETQICSHNEECFIEEILTPQQQIIFNAGCRSTTICKVAESQIGKRADNAGHIVCTHCCHQHNTNSTIECNANLCGIKTRSDHSNQCYYCGNDEDARQGAVTDPRTCRNIKFCPNDEVCRVTTSSIGGTIAHEFGCHTLLSCQVLTILNLQSDGVQTNIDISHLVSTGEIRLNGGRKRQGSICDVCCGDGLCNNDECMTVRNRLAIFAKANMLNYTTLRIIP